MGVHLPNKYNCIRPVSAGKALKLCGCGISKRPKYHVGKYIESIIVHYSKSSPYIQSKYGKRQLTNSGSIYGKALDIPTFSIVKVKPDTLTGSGYEADRFGSSIHSHPASLSSRRE